MKLRFSAVVGCLLLLWVVSCSENRYPEPLSAEEALESFELHEDFDIEVFASEPLVVDPVEMVFDERGDAYVMEMSDYPFIEEDLSDDEVVGEVSQYPTDSEIVEEGGRIRRLIDTDGDGIIDSSAVFAEGIREGTSILPWDGGLLVTSAPDILYLKDTNGDYRADTTEVLFTCFSTSNVQAQITSLRYGVDNRIYAANDGRPGEVTSGRDPEAPAVSIDGADFRFRLDRGQFERATGVGRVGRAINDWGHRFMTSPVPHIRQAVIPDRYLQRHAHMPANNAIENINDHGLTMYQLTSAPYWRKERSARRQREYDEAGIDRTEDVQGEFTGATGGTLYTGQAFPDEYYGNVFTGEHAGNLVHRDVLTLDEDSITYVASRAEEEKDREFLASTDPWFRPTTFTVGPDGYLYVIDMYRQHTEHPIAIPEDLKEDPDLDYTQGREHGRIYRIVHKENSSTEDTPANLAEMEPQQWVELLSHPNQWYRLTAQRLLLEEQDASVLSDVENVLGGSSDPKARLHALYVLEGLEALDAKHVGQAMEDAHPGVREHGMLLAERYPELLPELLEGTSDSSARVAFQASLSAGEFAGAEVVSTLADVIERHGQDAWFRTAVISAEVGASAEMMKELLGRASFTGEATPWKLAFLGDLFFAVGSRDRESEVASALELLSQEELRRDSVWQVAGLNGLAEGLQRQEALDPALEEALEGLGELESEEDIDERVERLREYYAGAM